MSAQQEIIDPPTLVESEATPQEKWALDWEAWEALYQEPWYLNQEEEPINYLGKSVLVRWLAQPKTEGEKEWSCCVPLKGETWCGHKIKRLDRAITHVRGHLNLRPYPCGGRCENENCTTRFGSNEYRSAHYQGPDNRECPWCGEMQLRQNLRRHKGSCPKKPSQTVEEESSASE